MKTTFPPKPLLFISPCGFSLPRIQQKLSWTHCQDALHSRQKAREYSQCSLVKCSLFCLSVCWIWAKDEMDYSFLSITAMLLNLYYALVSRFFFSIYFIGFTWRKTQQWTDIKSIQPKRRCDVQRSFCTNHTCYIRLQNEKQSRRKESKTRWKTSTFIQLYVNVRRYAHALSPDRGTFSACTCAACALFFFGSWQVFVSHADKRREKMNPATTTTKKAK